MTRTPLLQSKAARSAEVEDLDIVQIPALDTRAPHLVHRSRLGYWLWSQGSAVRLVLSTDLDSSSTARASQSVIQVATGTIEECLVEVDPAVA